MFTVESALALGGATACCYAFVCDSKVFPKSMINAFKRAASFNLAEKSHFDAIRAIFEIKERMRRVSQ